MKPDQASDPRPSGFGRRGLARNSLANLIRGASAGLGVFVLPPILVRVLPHDTYAAWALVLQIAAYVALLDLGLQVGIGRFVAREHAREDHAAREQFFFGGATLLLGCAAVALIATVVLAGLLPFLFPRISPELVPQCRAAILLIGGSTALSLPGSAIVSLFIGLERFAIPAVVVAVGRVIQCAVVSLVAISSRNLFAIGASFAACNVAIQLGYLFCLRRFGPQMKFHRSKILRPVMRELVRYCASVSVWTFSMLLVSGLDVAIVAEVDYKAVAEYSICANVIAALVGFVGSAFNVLIPRASALDGAGDREGVGRLLLKSTQLCTWGLLGIALIVSAFSKPLVSLWVGPHIAKYGVPILLILIVANTVRLLMTPYATILLGTGEQKWATWTALCEGVVNLVSSVILGHALGAIGVAYGTLIGGFVGVALGIAYTLPRTTRIACNPAQFLKKGLLVPASCWIPLFITTCLYLYEPGLTTLAVFLCGGVVSATLTLRFGPPVLRTALVAVASRIAL